MKILLMLLSVLAFSNVQAAFFKITPGNCTVTVGPATTDCSDSAELGTALTTLYTTIEEEAAANIPDVDGANYLEGVANSSIVAGKGLSTDYATDFDLFVVGGGIGGGFDLGDTSLMDVSSDGLSTFKGAAIGGTFMGGFNLGFLPLPKLGFMNWDRAKIYFNFFSLNLDSFAEELSGDVSSFGTHIQYKLMEGQSIIPGKMLRWNGIDVSLGYEYSNFEFSYTYQFTDISADTGAAVDIPLPGGGTDPSEIGASLSGNALLGAKITTHSIPIEVSTSLQTLYLFTPYMGFGADLNFGTATAAIGGNTEVALETDPGATASLSTTANGSFDLLDGAEASPASLSLRYFAGMQFNMWIFKGYVHYNANLAGGNIYGINAGLRVAW